MNRESNKIGLSVIVFWALFAASGLISLAPLWYVRILPMQDMWQHLALVDVIHNYDAPGSVYPEYFLLPSAPGPNLAYYYMTHWLGYLFPLETANKVVLSLYVVAFPLSFLYLMRSFNRSRWISFFSFPLIYNAMFAYGFVAFLLGMPLFMAGVGLFRRFVTGPANSPFCRSGFLVSATLLLAFFTHAHIFLLLVLMCIVLWALHRPANPWLMLLRTWPAIPSLVFFVPWFIVNFVQRAPSTSGRTFGSLADLFGPTYYRPGYVLGNFFHYVSDYFRTDTDDVLFLAMILVFVVLLMLRRAPDIPRGARRKLAVFDMEILTLVLALSLLAVPEHIESQSIVSLRHVVFTLMFLFGWVGFKGALRRVTVPAVVVLCLIHLATISNLMIGFEKFEDELDDYPSLFERADGGKRMIKALHNQDSDVTAYGALWHIHFFYMLERGGISDVQFAEYPHNPVQYRPGMVPPRTPVEFHRSPAWRYYDYVLVRKSSRPKTRPSDNRLDPVSEVSDWILYRVASEPLPRPPDKAPVVKGRRKQVACSGALDRAVRKYGGADVRKAIKNMGSVVPSIHRSLRRRFDRGKRNGPGRGHVGRPVRRRTIGDR